MDMKGKITSINQAFVDLTGFSKDEIVGKHFTKLGTIRLRDLLKYAKLVASVLKGKKRVNIEFKYLRKDGTERLGEAHIALIEEKGKKTGLQAILRDITEAKQIEQELKDSEEEYRSIVELSPDGIISLDKKGIVTSVNRAILTETEFSEKDFLGKHYTQLAAIPAENLSKLTPKMESFLKGDVPNVLEFIYCCKDGTQHFAEASIGSIKQKGKCAGLQILLRDITERKQMEQELKDSEEKYRVVVEQAPDAIVTFDAKGVVTSCNPAGLEMIGFSRKDTLGKSFEDLGVVRKVDTAKFGKLFKSISDQGVPEPFVVDYFKNG